MTTRVSPPPASSASSELTLVDQQRMVDALQRQLQACHPGAPVERFETHISFVLVAGGLAWKFKKAVAPGFLDFTTLARRRHYCEEELRLNRRLAPALYLDVVGVTGTADEPELGGTGPAIDCAVRMRAFDQQGLWDRLAARDELAAAHLDELATQLVGFHRDAAVAEARSDFGAPVQVRAPVLDNLRVLARLLTGAADQDGLRTLADWEAAQFAQLEPVFAQRRHDGCIRECHGDLHLGNVALVDGRTTVFDCIEFNEGFRWIDVVSELAFMAMDLHFHRRHDLAHRLVDHWLEGTGDYAGARVLRYYLAYRALVRAKVHALRAEQEASSSAGQARDRQAAHGYLALALGFTQVPARALMITHGCSGSGKTTASQGLVEELGMVRIRADVERKRLFGLEPLQRSGSPLGAALYGPEATARTYARLGKLATQVLQGGFGVVLDATFLGRAQRDQARRLAREQGVAFVILDFEVDTATLRERVHRRAEQGSDASEADLAVLEAQLASAEPLTHEERGESFACGGPSAASGSAAGGWGSLQRRIERECAGPASR